MAAPDVLHLEEDQRQVSHLFTQAVGDSVRTVFRLLTVFRHVSQVGEEQVPKQRPHPNCGGGEELAQSPTPSLREFLLGKAATAGSG